MDKQMYLRSSYHNVQQFRHHNQDITKRLPKLGMILAHGQIIVTRSVYGYVDTNAEQCTYVLVSLRKTAL